MDTDGNPSSVASIHVSVVPDAVAGLSFAYASGDTYTLGSMDGEISTLRLDNGEELARLDTTMAMVNHIYSVVSISVRSFVNSTRIQANMSIRSIQTTSE